LPPEVAEMPEKLMVFSLVDMRFPLAATGTGAASSRMEYWGMGDLWRDPQGRPVDATTVFVLVNGMWKPKLTMEEGKWYRLRMLFASVELVIAAAPLPWLETDCEMQLLAKDGVYLNVAPREVRKVLLSPGARADAALRCWCKPGQSGPCKGGIGTKAALSEKFNTWGKDGSHPLKQASGTFHVHEDALEQLLVHLEVTPAPKREHGATLPSFRVKRPCYLADLRGAQVPEGNRKDIVFPSPGKPIDKRQGPSSWASIWWKDAGADKRALKGAPMMMGPKDHDPKPLFELPGGSVAEFWIGGTERGGGLSYHPFHLHVTPYQLTHLGEPKDDYFQEGDWHDSFMYSAGEAKVRFQTSTFTGPYVMHCHILSHEDMGMMAFFNVAGKDGRLWPGAKQLDPTCYENKTGAGFAYVGA